MSATTTPPAPASGTTTTTSSPPIAEVRWNAPQALITYFTLALIVACLSIAYVTADKGTIELVVGAVIGWAGSSITFWMGSSHSSQTKDAMIASQLPNAPPPATTTTTTGAPP